MPINNLPIEVAMLRVVQPLGEFFAAVLPVELLLQVTYSDPLRIAGFSTTGEYQLEGHQRKLIEDRLKAIGRYVDTVEAAFPNSIILAANYTEAGALVEDETKRWKVELSKDSLCGGKLIIPSLDKIAAIVDGQHRLYGFNHSQVKARTEMPLLCAVYLDLPNPFQAYLFATINYNQKPVDKSQSYELYGYNLEEEESEVWSPEKTAVFLCRKLNTDEKSAFRGHIIVAAQNDAVIESAAKDQKKEWAVSTATIVEGLLRLFSSNPKKDRDTMHRLQVGKGRERKVLLNISPADRTPLRDFYVQNRDVVIYTLAKNFFNAVSDLLWEGNNRYYIRKTIGIQALFDVLRDLAPLAIEEKDLSEKFFINRLAPCAKVNFADSFIQASGGVGRQRIRNSLQLRLGLKKLHDLPEDERDDYRRVCQL